MSRKGSEWEGRVRGGEGNRRGGQWEERWEGDRRRGGKKGGREKGAGVPSPLYHVASCHLLPLGVFVPFSHLTPYL